LELRESLTPESAGPENSRPGGFADGLAQVVDRGKGPNVKTRREQRLKQGEFVVVGGN
jgi:hypothetical protein